MSTKTYYVFDCVAKRKDKTEIFRKIQIQAHYQIEDLAMALMTQIEDPYDLVGFDIAYDETSLEFNNTTDKIYFSYTFNELESKKVTITFKYDDGVALKFVCKKIDTINVEKTITRKTPILLEATGFKKVSLAEHLKTIPELYLSYSKDGLYSKFDNIDLKEFKFKMEQFFTFYKEIYYSNYYF